MAEEMSYVYDIETFKKFILKNNRFTMLYMYAEDNEGKEYKKKIERIYKMKKKFQRVLKGGDSYNNIKY